MTHSSASPTQSDARTKPSPIIMNKYRVLSKKGEGTFSEVLRVVDIHNGHEFAVKCMKSLFPSMKQVNELREIQALRRLNPHPNIIAMHEILYDPHTGRLAIVMELMQQNIYEMIRHRRDPLTAELVRSLMYQLLVALCHMHDHGVFHRDIKPENVLVIDNRLKVADLGSCRGLFSQPPYTEYISTRWYRAPECLLTNGYYDYKMDLWGVGCVFYELVTFHPLFPGQNELDQIDKIHSVLGTPHKSVLAAMQQRAPAHVNAAHFAAKKGTGFAHLLPPSLVSPEMIDLISQLLIYNPEKRITARQALQHKYFDAVRTDTTLAGKASLSLVGAISPTSPPKSQSTNHSEEEKVVLAQSLSPKFLPTVNTKTSVSHSSVALLDSPTSSVMLTHDEKMVSLTSPLHDANAATHSDSVGAGNDSESEYQPDSDQVTPMISATNTQQLHAVPAVPADSLSAHTHTAAAASSHAAATSASTSSDDYSCDVYEIHEDVEAAISAHQQQVAEAVSQLKQITLTAQQQRTQKKPVKKRKKDKSAKKAVAHAATTATAVSVNSSQHQQQQFPAIATKDRKSHTSSINSIHAHSVSDTVSAASYASPSLASRSLAHGTHSVHGIEAKGGSTGPLLAPIASDSGAYISPNPHAIAGGHAKHFVAAAGKKRSKVKEDAVSLGHALPSFLVSSSIARATSIPGAISAAESAKRGPKPSPFLSKLNAFAGSSKPVRAAGHVAAHVERRN